MNIETVTIQIQGNRRYGVAKAFRANDFRVVTSFTAQSGRIQNIGKTVKTGNLGFHKEVLCQSNLILANSRSRL